MVTGGPETGADFSGLAFDHLLFTGATSIAKHVMRAAAENLVPVTLELGGKSPVIVGREAEMDKTTDSIMMGKTMNAGQICLAPDYVFVPEEKMDDFVDSAKRSVSKMFPTLVDNPDYTSVINDRHFERIIDSGDSDLSLNEDPDTHNGSVVKRLLVRKLQVSNLFTDTQPVR